MSVIVCGGYIVLRREVGKCYGACGIEDAPLTRTEGSPYYGPDWRCAICGDSWSTEGLYPRPFARGWRQKAIRKAVAMWEAGCSCEVERDDDYYPEPCTHDEVRRAAA